MLTITVDFDTAEYLIEHKKSFHVSPADVNQYGITHVENDYTFSNSYENDCRYTIEKTLLHVAIENGNELVVVILPHKNGLGVMRADEPIQTQTVLYNQ